MGFYKLEHFRARLINYGYWVLHDSDVGPDSTRCTSLESKHVPDAGEVFESDIVIPVPNVSDAEKLHEHIRRLDNMQQYCLIARIMCMIGMDSEYPAVFRMRRVGDHAMQKMADNAEENLRASLMEVA